MLRKALKPGDGVRHDVECVYSMASTCDERRTRGGPGSDSHTGTRRPSGWVTFNAQDYLLH
jgi:hypothetical protein